MDADTLQLLHASLRSLLAERPTDIAGALAGLGWSEVLAEDAAAATSALFDEQGGALTSTAALDGVAAGALGIPASTRVIWPDPRRGSAAVALAGGRIRLSGIVLSPVSGQLVVPLGDGVVPVEPAVLRVAPLVGIDPDAGWLLVEGETDAARPVGSWPAAVTAARRALAAELVGVSRRALDTACDHVRSRVQFGRPIGSYQSVRHRLAGAFAGLVGAQALLSAAWVDGSPFAAAAAKAAAGRVHAEVVREAMQVCGGMGLSDEHPVPRCVRRGFLLDALLGSAPSITREHGARLLGGLEPPRVGAF